MKKSLGLVHDTKTGKMSSVGALPGANGALNFAQLPDTIMGSAGGVNDRAWVVGTAGGEFAVPCLHADGTSYTLQSLLPTGSGSSF